MALEPRLTSRCLFDHGHAPQLAYRGGNPNESWEDEQDTSVLCCCCGTKFPHTWWLPTTRTHHLTVLGVKSQGPLFQGSLN